MIVYTGNTYGNRLEELLKRPFMGIMCASSASEFRPHKDWKQTNVALDNGAFQCWQRGYPFMEKHFLKTLERCYEVGLTLDFVVCPDMVGRGWYSYDFSMEWADHMRLGTANNLAFAVQDGMTPSKFTCSHEAFSTIFVGGTERWKWDTAAQWVTRARELGMSCHIGRCGTLEKLQTAFEIGADSVDSVNFSRNGSWEVVDRLFGGNQEDMFLGRNEDD